MSGAPQPPAQRSTTEEIGDPQAAPERRPPLSFYMYLSLSLCSCFVCGGALRARVERRFGLRPAGAFEGLGTRAAAWRRREPPELVHAPCRPRAQHGFVGGVGGRRHDVAEWPRGEPGANSLGGGLRIECPSALENFLGGLNGIFVVRHHSIAHTMVSSLAGMWVTDGQGDVQIFAIGGLFEVYSATLGRPVAGKPAL